MRAVRLDRGTNVTFVVLAGTGTHVSRSTLQQLRRHFSDDAMLIQGAIGLVVFWVVVYGAWWAVCTTRGVPSPASLWSNVTVGPVRLTACRALVSLLRGMPRRRAG